ncbi:MAG: 2-oxoacid:acceptor oxidoreductase subunit alpha [Paludibacter sp.]|nr:2-oxoacid:acceptor oxidoreductase subunit alpha [Bacteroidales bacterium]MCM1069915.1 2-oxoacid:acceptor oxidoreductase subunit alpha [Prevotella sp.]MCM1354668.1 2-oxoacid:acceptor oxidoreductase subunit alpha [Bacteroides sp.]MCM1443491.1 2-oxoacid:acceptor oxidoreductase subunit alpha [Muribaculum sp.]MCM1482597.1 2-oxoacid:acceptor oxidoreductase subunit alpha [Paludibacter sp.]
MNTPTPSVVIRFCGDSGDGMQLTGTLFSNLSAILGNEISTFPDFPAEIRAPQGTLGGVSGFQVHIGAEHIYTPGDKADVLIAMNPAALKVNTHNIHPHSIIIIDTDSFTTKDLEKAQYKTDNPFTELRLPESVQIVPIALTTLTKESLSNFGMDNKAVIRSKNMFALGVVCWLFNRPIEQAEHFLENKFRKKPELLTANSKVLTDGYNYAANLHLNINTFIINKSDTLAHGRYTSIAGNKATAWGLIAAAEKANKHLFLGSYPITPATDIMHELAARKDVGVMVVQAEDEIAGVCTAIGASFAGDLAVTTTSGPGLSLKSEAIGLAVMAELPLVIVDVQRGGPSTGLPTKTEQADLLQALYGRNGECPLVVLAASTPDNCFHYAYQAAKIALEHMTPVILLSDTYLANGTALWKLPELAQLPAITPQSVPESLQGQYNTAMRNRDTLVRYWAIPGMQGFEHRNIGLERDADKGSISTSPANHARMIATRQQKIDNIATTIPPLQVYGNPDADILLVGFGSTEGHLKAATNLLNQQNIPTATAIFNYICPLPANTQDILSQYQRIIVCELNNGQFATWLRSHTTGLNIEQFNKLEAQPFAVCEIVDHILHINDQH